jgi:hypothetical protein
VCAGSFYNPEGSKGAILHMLMGICKIKKDFICIKENFRTSHLLENILCPVNCQEINIKLITKKSLNNVLE